MKKENNFSNDYANIHCPLIRKMEQENKNPITK